MATRYHQLFAIDLAEACSHYDSIASSLGNRFRMSVRTAIKNVVDRPDSFGRIGGDFRGALVDRFPYVVVFILMMMFRQFTVCVMLLRTVRTGLVEQYLERADNEPMHLSHEMGRLEVVDLSSRRGDRNRL